MIEKQLLGWFKHRGRSFSRNWIFLNLWTIVPVFSLESSITKFRNRFIAVFYYNFAERTGTPDEKSCLSCISVGRWVISAIQALEWRRPLTVYGDAVKHPYLYPTAFERWNHYMAAAQNKLICTSALFCYYTMWFSIHRYS